MSRVYRSFLLLFFLLSPLLAYADDDTFVIEDIRVEGLQRISAGTVFNYLPVSIGSTLAPQDYPSIIRALFQTGFFTDVGLKKDGNDLIVSVVERPAIAEINISGNKDIKTEDLTKGLEEIGLEEGEVFDRALLDKVEQELIRQYYGRGKYAVRVETEVRPLERNRVAIDLDISEGVAARIRQINIVGNEAFSDEELLDEFQLAATGWFSFWTQSNQYSKQKLAADIEALRSFYLDRGYLKFALDSTQVSITPDKKDIYITINISEGEPYTVKEIALAGDLVVPESELRELITIEPGETFSRSTMAEMTQLISDRLGEEGYAFANVNTVPELEEENNQVALTFIIDPGRRVYVRRINFAGNVKTHDEVLRRELRQMESTWFSTKDINRSKERLERLRYLESVDVETPAVPGTVDQVDINYSIVERPSGNLIFGAGFGQESGILLNASLNQDNFLGTGNTFNFIFNNSRTNTNYTLAFNNPYYTLDGVSRGFRLYYRERDAEEANTADYVVDGFGGEINFGFPINEFDVIRTGFGVENINVNDTDDTPPEILDFLEENGDAFTNGKINVGWSRDDRNRVIFPDAGNLNRIALEGTVPGSDLEYFKIDYKYLGFYNMARFLTVSLGGELGYGDGYAGTDELPFFENYLAGGISSIRGFEANTLGPRYASTNDPQGGSVKIIGNLEVILPFPFLEDSNTSRLFAFIDGGNVFSSTNDVTADGLRFSAGFGGRWLSPLGPLAISIGFPLNEKSDDDTEAFQFSFGVPF